MTDDEYNNAELIAGRLTISHVTALVRHFQASVPGLQADGMAGQQTRSHIEKLMPEDVRLGDMPFLSNPLPKLVDGRFAGVTSEFKPADRPNHKGVDLFYRWKEGDLPSKIGDRLAAGRNHDGTPRWVIPFGVQAIAAADGTVQIAGNSDTGYRVWIDHRNGLRSGYFHLLDLRVSVGQRVTAGTPLGLVGDNPVDNDGRHLHFELSPVGRYAPVDPMPFFVTGSVRTW